MFALIAPKTLHLGSLLVVAPALTASFAGPRTTAAIGVLAVLAQIGLRVARGELSMADNVIQVSAVVLITVIVVVYAALRERRLREIAQVRMVSEAAQRVVMRPLPDRIGPLRISSVYLAATAEARVGGDLYAAVRGDDRTRLIIGDVSGNGLPTIADAAALVYAFRQAARQDLPLPTLVTHLESSVLQNLADVAETDPNSQENFVTAVTLQVPDGRPWLELIDCGHPPPLLVRGQEVIALDARRPTLPLGLGELAEDGYEVETFPFEPGDLLLLYTDGVIEARDSAGDFYPMRERIRAWSCLDPDAFVSRLRDDLLTFVGGRLHDDAALAVVKREYV